MSKKLTGTEAEQIEAQIPADFRMMLPHRVKDVVARTMKGEALFHVIVEIRDEERRSATGTRKAEDADGRSADAPTTKSRKGKKVETDADAQSSDVEP